MSPNASKSRQANEEHNAGFALFQQELITAEPFEQWSTRYSDQPMPLGTRLIGISGVVMVALLIMSAALLTWRTYLAPPARESMSVFNIAPPASPQETPPVKDEAPKPRERQEQQAQPRMQPNQDTTLPVAPAKLSLPAVATEEVDANIIEPDTVAPKTIPAPPAPQLTSKGADSWEGRVLAQLNKHRRYPRLAMMRRQQGVPYIRFVMDREGKVLSAQLERSSGYVDLDLEAVALAKRASPLPKPPADKPGDTLELIVPVEFFMR